MHDTIWNPGKNVEQRMAESRENITDVRAVPDRLKSRKHGHPDMRASGYFNKTTGVEKEQPQKNGCGREKELRGEGNAEHQNVQKWDNELVWKRGFGHDHHRKHSNGEHKAIFEAVLLRHFVRCQFFKIVAR